MKNICIFAANYLPNIGGIERYTYYLSKELINRGHNVTIVTNDIFDLGEKEITEYGATLYRFPCHKFINGRFPVYIKNAVFKRIKQELLKNNYDLIIINARFYIHSLFAAKFAKKKNIPVITIEHGSTHLSVNNKLLDYLGGLLEHFITMLLKRNCKDFYGVSKTACEWSSHFNIKSKGPLYNAVDVDEINTLSASPVCDYRKALKISKDATVIAFTGRIIPEKGIFNLVDAFKRINDKNVYLIIAGDGSSYSKLEESIGDNTYLLGKIDFPHVISLLSQSDIFCLPSVSEGMPTSVLEAIAAKCFVITTETGGAKEVIHSNELGIITKSNSVIETYEALKTALEDPIYRKSACKKCYDELKANFTWKSTADKIEKIIEKNI